jgi:predicted permease
MSDREQERLRKLREQQLQSRDPLTKQRKIQRNISAKEKRMRKPFSLAKAWGEIPHIVKVPFYGLIIGVLAIIFLPAIWDSPYATIAGGVITLILIAFGLAFGNSLDIRDRIRDNIK